MKFDYVIGNPPYQGPTSQGGKGSSKLYFKVTKKALDLCKDEIAFVTPRPILQNGAKNSAYEQMKTTRSINDADGFFKESTNAIWWVNNPNSPHLQKKYNNKPIRHLYEAYHRDLNFMKEFYPLFQKISYTMNKFPKLRIKPSHFPLGVPASAMTTSGQIEVIHQSRGDGPSNRKIKYLKEDSDLLDSLKTGTKLVVPYSSSWFTPFITNEITSEFFGVISAEDYNLMNVKSFIETQTIKNFILGYSKMTGSNYFNALWKLPEVDFSHPWTDDEVQILFRIKEQK